MLAVVFGFKKLQKYFLCIAVIVIVTDHKPVIPIFNKPLIKALQCLQSMLLKIQQYSTNLVYKTDTPLKIADAPSQTSIDENENLFFFFLYSTTNMLRQRKLSHFKLNVLKCKLANDSILKKSYYMKSNMDIQNRQRIWKIQ